MSEIIDTHRMEDGTEYRVRLSVDPAPEQPYDDGQWPILKVEYNRYQGRHTAEAFNDAANPYVDKFNELTNRGYDMEVFIRYIRIFHGGTAMFEYGVNRVTDYTYLAFDTAVWRATVGTEDTAALALEKPLSEIQAWLEGDVYGIVSEKRYNPDQELDDDEDWDEEGSVWGYYGREYAESAAKDQIEVLINSHKTVYRYPEAEKLAKVSKEVSAIMGFLEWAAFSIDITDARERDVHQFYDINPYKLEQERRLMLKRLTESEGTTQQ